MSDYQINDLTGAVQRIMLDMSELEVTLNAADAHLGDGDTGAMLARLLASVSDAAPAPDIGATLIAYAKAAGAATGSSLGTLISSALLTVGRQTKGRLTLSPQDLSGLLATARDTMLARGQASLGDKTVIDAVHALSVALSDQRDRGAVKTAATIAVDAVLAQYRDQTCKIGRARMYADRSRGLDDPGMLAFARIVQAAAGLPARD